MKHTIYYFKILILLFSFNQVHAGWYQVNQTFQNQLYKIRMVNTSVGYAIGIEGVIMKTTDGGATWKGVVTEYPVTPLATNEFLDLSFTSATVGYVAGIDETLFKTMDGGNTWQKITINGSMSDILTVHFTSDETGYIGFQNGKIYKTTNGGVSWSLQSSGVTTEIRAIRFVDASTGWFISTAGVVKKTTDGGGTWTTQNSGTTISFISASFISASKGWLTDGSSIFVTTNGGSSWAVQTNTNSFISEIHFTDANNGWISRKYGLNSVYRTSDGGATWTPQFNTGNADLFSVHFINSSLGVACGSANQIFRTTNGGTNWTSVNAYVSGDHLYAIHFNSSTGDGWCGGTSGRINKSSNGGETWTTQTTGISTNILGIYAISGSTAWITGSAGKIVATTNGGTTWTAQTSGVTSQLWDIKFNTASNGLCVGDAGVILKTTNGGATWSAVSSGITGTIRNVFYASSTVVYAVGHTGVILKSTNGGSTWASQTSGITTNLLGVHFTSITEGYACGAAGKILKTVNGGTNWTAQTTGTTKYFSKILFTSANNGWAVGESGTIFRTLNGGTNWTAQKSFTYQHINHVALNNSGELVAGAQVGVIAKFRENCPALAPTNYTVSERTGICPNTSTTLTAIGQGKISWYSAASGGTYLGTGNIYNSTVLSANKTYYAQDSTCSAGSRTAIAVSIITPTITSTQAGARCGSGSVVISAVSNTGTVVWYAAASGGTALDTGDFFQTPTISNSTNYYAEAVVKGKCVSTSRTLVLATIKTIPTFTSIPNAERCGSGTLNLIPTASAFTINWYASDTGSVVLYTGSTYTTPILDSTTKYYISTTDAGCTSPRSPIIATILPVPNNATTRVGSILTATQTGATYQWIDCSNNTPMNGETNRDLYPKVNGSYAVIITLGNCKDTSDCVVVTNVGIRSLTGNSQVQVYPNPTSGAFYLKNNSDAWIHFEMMDMKGILLKKGKTNDAVSKIDLTELPVGIYILKTTTNSQETLYTKIIKH